MHTLLAAVSEGDLLALVVRLVIASLIFYCIWWGIGAIGIPEPFRKIIVALVVLCAVVWLISQLGHFGA